MCQAGHIAGRNRGMIVATYGPLKQKSQSNIGVSVIMLMILFCVIPLPLHYTLRPVFNELYACTCVKRYLTAMQDVFIF